MRFELNKVGLLAALAVAFLFTPDALADLIHLTNGQTLHGEVVSEEGDFVVVRMPYGTLRLRKEQVESVEKQSNAEYTEDVAKEMLARGRFVPAIEQLEAARAKDPKSDDVKAALSEACVAYAKHLQESNRLSEAKQYFERALKLVPNGADAAAARGALEQVEAGRKGLDVLAKEGEQLLTQGKIEEAISKFEGALSRSPDARELVATPLAVCYAHRAETQYHAGHFAEAAATLETAFTYDVSLAAPLENFYTAASLRHTLSLLQNGKLPDARAQLERLLSFAPGNGQALYIAGRVESSQRNYSAACTYYGRVLKQEPRRGDEKEAAQLQADTEKALNIDAAKLQFDVAPVDTSVYAKADTGAFESIETDHFRIYHHNAQLGQALGDTLEAQRTRIMETTGLKADWKDKPKVYLHRSQEEYTESTGMPAWSGGVSRYVQTPQGLKDPMISSWQTSPRLLKSVVPHELTHLIVNQGLRGAHDTLPRAIQEGVAVLMEPDFRHDSYMKLLRMRLQSKDFIPLPELLTMKDYPKDPDLFYAEGYAFCAYVNAKIGGAEFWRMVLNEDGGTFDAHVLAKTGASGLDALEREWRASYGRE